MKRSRSARLFGAALIGTVALATATVTDAGAGSNSRSSYSGDWASTNWIEVGVLDGIPGNVHVGQLYVDGSTRVPQVHGFVVDWTCPEGELPPTHGHGIGLEFDEPVPEPPPTNCTHQGLRFIDAERGAVEFRLDNRLTKARLTGNLRVSAHDETGSVAYPPVDITFTGIGDTYEDRWTFTWSSDGWTSTTRYTGSFRSAAVDGRIGPMFFTDDADDVSTGGMGRFREMTKSMSR